MLPNFTKNILLTDPQFVSYKQSLGISELRLDNPEQSLPIAENVIETAKRMFLPAKGYLHNPTEFAALYEVVSGLHNINRAMPAGHVFNSGTFRGSSACLVAIALKDRNTPTPPVITIDPFTYAHTMFYASDTPMAVLVDHYKLIDEFNLQDNIISIIYEDTKYFTHAWGDQPISIAVVDTDKSPDHFREQINMLMPLIPPGGWFITHDYMPIFNDFLIAVHHFITTCPRQMVLFSAWAYLFIHFLT